nr:Chain A, Preproalbumin PawS1 [Perymenium macrocephalum]
GDCYWTSTPPFFTCTPD